MNNFSIENIDDTRQFNLKNVGNYSYVSNSKRSYVVMITMTSSIIVSI